MPAAWELAPSSAERTEDALTTFILFCEDKVSEPFYFRSFEREHKVKINVAEGQLSSFDNVSRNLAHCVKEGLLEVFDGVYRIAAGATAEIWSVFDRDVESESMEEADGLKDVQFTTAIGTARSAGIKVAWSNDVFELWILLHFEDVEPGVWQHRNYVYERLTAIFRALPDQSPDMASITSRRDFYYKDYFKRRVHFVPYVLPWLTAERRREAIRRARELEAAFSGVAQSRPLHEWNPCTMVYQLVERIVSFADQGAVV